MGMSHDYYTNNPERPSLARNSHGNHRRPLTRIQSDPRLQAIRQSKQQPLAASLILVCLTSGKNIHFHIQTHTVYIWILGYSSPNLAQLPCHPAPLPPHLYPCRPDSSHRPGSQGMNLVGYLWPEAKTLAPSPNKNTGPDTVPCSHKATYSQRRT